jgi:general secretion pathway protein I
MASINVKRRAGFTLLEMLLAVVVIATVGITVSNAVGGVASQTFTLERRTMAHWVAQNQLQRLRISLKNDDSAIPEGKDSVRIFMGERDWEVQTEVTATDHPWVRRVEVDVFELQAGGKRQGPFDHSVAFVGRY